MTSRLDNRPRPDTTAKPDSVPSPHRDAKRVPTFGLSGTQLVATGLAGATATFAASYFGVAGTVVGASVVSITTAVGNAVYGTSLRSTRDRVRAAATRSIPVGTASSNEPPVLPYRRPRPGPAHDRAPIWRRAALAGVGIFVVLMAVVTGVELIAGRPVSDVVRGKSGGGTSFFGHETVRTVTVPPTTPTVTVTVTPKVEFTTPTVTQTAPATTATPSSSPTPTATTATPSVTPSDTPSATSSTP